MRSRPAPAPGFTLLEMMIVVLLIGVIAAIAIPMLTESRTSANESSAIGSMKTLATVQAQFKEKDGDLDNVLDFAADLTELSSAGLIDNVLGSGLKSGYRFFLSGSTHEWQATATPYDPNQGKRAFYVDVQGVIRFATGSIPDRNSTPIGN